MKVLIILIGLLTWSVNVKAQNIDSLYNIARELAFQGKRSEARLICKDILSKQPQAYDTRVLLARTLAWDKMYDSARIELNIVLKKKFGHYDAMDALTDIELWNKNYEECIKQCNIALSFNDKSGFKIKQAKALKGLERYDEALLKINSVIEVEPSNESALKLKEELTLLLLKNKFSAKYAVDYFENNNPIPWHLFYLQYARKMSFGSLIGRLNYAKRYSYKGVQAEIDAYPKIDKLRYAYLNLGYANSKLFPKFRCGGELYQKLPKSLEASLGFRYLTFSNSNVTIFTAYLGKYIGNYWISGRTFITPKSAGMSMSGILLARKYFSSKDNYLGIRFNYGVSPDERKRDLSSLAVLSLKSQGIRVEYSCSLRKRWVMQLALMGENEEWYPHKFRNILTGDIGLSFKF